MVWAIIVIILLAGADQLIKVFIRSQLAVTDQIAVIDDFFYIVNRKNTGAAWSFLAGQDWGIYALAAVSAVVTALLIFIIFKTGHVKLQVCLAIISGGSLGNLIDRLFQKGVTDFLDFHFGSYIFPTFNLADMLIVSGTALLAILILTDKTLLDNWMKKGDNLDRKEREHGSDHTD